MQKWGSFRVYNPAIRVLCALFLGFLGAATILALRATAANAVGAKCSGVNATLVGTHRPDSILGRPDRDVVHAHAMDDKVKGYRDADLICGGKGADRLNGNRGSDRVMGQDGRDGVLGGAWWPISSMSRRSDAATRCARESSGARRTANRAPCRASERSSAV